MSVLTAEQKKALTDAFSSATKRSSAPPSSRSSALSGNDPKRTVAEATSQTLDPLSGSQGIHADIAYLSMTSSDIIGLSFNGNDTFETQNGSLFGKVTFIVPVADVALAVGKTVQVIYAVVRQESVFLSETLELVVQPIAQEKLPTPQVTEASEDVLDLTAFEGDAHVTVAPWPLIDEAQTVWLTVMGPEGVPTIKLLEAYPITEPDERGGIKVAIARAELDKFEDGSELTVVCKVGFTGGANEIGAVELPILKVTIIVKPTAAYEDFETMTVGDYLVGSSVTRPTMTITTSGYGYAIISQNVSTGITNQVVRPYNKTTVIFTLTPAAKSVKLKGSMRYGIMHIRFFDGPNLLHTIDAPTGVDYFWGDYTAQPNKKISHVTVECPGDTGYTPWIDDFTLTY